MLHSDVVAYNFCTINCNWLPSCCHILLSYAMSCHNQWFIFSLLYFRIIHTWQARCTLTKTTIHYHCNQSFVHNHRGYNNCRHQHQCRHNYVEVQVRQNFYNQMLDLPIHTHHHFITNNYNHQQNYLCHHKICYLQFQSAIHFKNFIITTKVKAICQI